MLTAVKNIWLDFVSLLFPEYCYACEKALVQGENIICTNCRLKLPYTNNHIPFGNPDNIFLRRFYGKVPVKYAFAYLYFKSRGRVQRLLHELKYRGVQEVGETLGYWYGASLKQHGYAMEFDLILPVPLHKVKLRKRGYNQTDSFAQGLAQGLEIDWSNKILTRTVNTTTQTKKTRPERWANVEQVFKVTNPEFIIGKRILLVDDVITTGATLEACALTLLNAGCKEISVGAIAAA